MTSPFERALEFVFKMEGGYSNDTNDPGGETKFGISKRAYPDLDIANLTREKAAELYRTDYFDACKCGQLPAPLAMLVFDAAVNQGTDAAIRMLQDALGVKVDGVIGPVTLAAAMHSNLKESVPSLVAARSMRYALNVNLKLYGKGWFRRLAACHETALDPL